ncbi:MAG: hypothetical protein AAF298_08755 [Cyanobacteria bacterium P01_A01_bin.40]
MIHHISLPARDPLNVAEVLTELFNNSYCAPFPSHPGSYMAFAGDEYGTLVEVYPLETEMMLSKADNPIQYQQNSAPQFITTHAVISIPLDQFQIESIAHAEQWRCLRCDRGNFEVIEFWIENTVLLELVTPELTQQYTEALAPAKLAAYLIEAIIEANTEVGI